MGNGEEKMTKCTASDKDETWFCQDEASPKGGGNCEYHARQRREAVRNGRDVEFTQKKARSAANRRQSKGKLELLAERVDRAIEAKAQLQEQSRQLFGDESRLFDFVDDIDSVDNSIAESTVDTLSQQSTVNTVELTVSVDDNSQSTLSTNESTVDNSIAESTVDTLSQQSTVNTVELTVSVDDNSQSTLSTNESTVDTLSQQELVDSRAEIKRLQDENAALREQVAQLQQKDDSEEVQRHKGTIETQKEMMKKMGNDHIREISGKNQEIAKITSQRNRILNSYKLETGKDLATETPEKKPRVDKEPSNKSPSAVIQARGRVLPPGHPRNPAHNVANNSRTGKASNETPKTTVTTEGQPPRLDE